jgi:hypothetical protein
LQSTVADRLSVRRRIEIALDCLPESIGAIVP